MRHFTRGQHFLALLITKFLYGTRIITIFYLAKERVSFWRFSWYNAIVTGIWAIVVCSIGWSAGKGVTWVEAVYNNLSIALALLALILAVLYGTRIWLNKIIIEKDDQ